jgi:uncharacterized protein (TIGR03083 family)
VLARCDLGCEDGRVTSGPFPPVRLALEAAVAQFLASGAAIGPQQWDQPATDRWTVRQLFAHMVRGMSVLSGYLDADLEPTGPPLAGAAGYFRTALAVDGIHDGIAARATEAADSAPDDVLAWAREVSATMLNRATATADDTAIVHFTGWLRFDDYLVTRVAELVLHGFDLQLACGLDIGAPAPALAVVNPLLLELADRADPRALALALTGRVQPFPCDVLG